MTLSLTAALFAGILSFLSPCVLPLVPTYLLYLGGDRGRPIFNALFFILGFSAIFLLLGFPFTLLSNLMLVNRRVLVMVGGVAMLLFGLYMVGLKPRFLMRRINLRHDGDASRPWGAFTLGLVLGIGWTPCIGPILGSILTLTATGAGFPFLLSYVVGLAIPFLLVALFADRAKALVKRVGAWSHRLEVAGGVMLMMVGVLMLTGQFTIMNSYFLRITPLWLLDRL
jgi:cytochrome c-type biogenesis protein